jgi:sugar-specific transcriptional regulator TrmB
MVAVQTYLPVRKALRALGFSDGEVKVLSFLFFKKQATSKEISKNTAISFSTVQYHLTNLNTRGLVSCVPGKNDEHVICSEKDLFIWIEEQKKKSESVYDEAKNTIVDFFESVQKSSWKPDVTYYEGKTGIQDLYLDMLEAAKDSDKKIYSWLDIPKIHECLGDFLYEYIDQRMKFGIKSHDIVPRNEMNLKHDQKQENREIHFVDHLPIDGEIRIFADRVAVITFHEEKPVGFVLHGKNIATIFRAIFENAWNQ